MANYKNRGLGPLGPSILDPIYVIYAFGSMLSCILCERQKFSESHKLKCFGAWNQFQWQNFSKSHKLRRFGTQNQFRAERFVKMTLKMTKSNYGKIVVWDHSEQRDLWPFCLLDLVWIQWN